MFEPILQLKALRYRCLLIRELCLRAGMSAARGSYFHDANLLAWRTSRLIGGWLHGHPNSQYHPKTSVISRLVLRSHAASVALTQWGERRQTLWLHAQLELVAQACADIRAVTSSVAINDILGRRQPEIASLQRAMSAAAAFGTPLQRPSVAVATGAADDTWPFLSI